MKTNKTKLVWTILLTVFSVEITIFLVGIVLLNPPLFLKDFSELAFSKKPETFTELYFTDHLSLPKQIKQGVPYYFEFTVHNLEYKDFTYVYEVTADTLILENGQFSLKHDETKTIPITFRISQPFERTKITVNLVNKNQPIHFWIEQEGF